MTERTDDRDALLTELQGLRRRVAELECAEQNEHCIQQALRDGEYAARELVDQANSIILRMDTQGCVMFLNGFGQAFFGFGPDEIVGRSVVGTIVPQTDSSGRDLGEMIRDIIAYPGRYASNENENMRRDGQRVWVAWTNKGLTDEQGRVLEILCVGNDITSRKRMEARLQEREATARAILDASSAAIVLLDREGTVLDVNNVYSSRFGMTRDEYVGRSVYEGVPADVAQRRKALSEQVFRTGEPVRAQDCRAGIWNDYVIHPVRGESGEVACVAVYAQDITDRVLAEQALRDSEERYRAVVEDLPMLVCRFRPDLVITFVNDAYCGYFGKTTEELVGRDFMGLISPEDRDEVRARLTSLSPDRPVDTYEHRVIGADGQVRWQRWTDRALFDDQGRVTCFQSIGSDITEQRLIEERVRQTHKMEAVGQLAGGIAHDFNNLLTGILGYASLLKLEAAPGSSVYEAAETIEQAADRASQLTSQLLGFARKGQHRILPVDLHRLIGECLLLLSRTLDKKIRIKQRLHADRAIVLGDPGQLEQVLLNLAVNAGHAMPEGGVLTIETDRVELDEPDCQRLSGLRPGAHVRVTVSDTGRGIPEGIRDRIFEPFFTTKRPGEGTGMGLAMVYGIVTAHGGAVDVASRPGRGSTFTMHLPASNAAEPDAAEPEAGEIRRGQGRVLVVDDEETVRAVASAMLSTLGYDVIAAENGREAVEFYQLCSDDVDLVLLDMIMPEMDGRDCFNSLRRIDPSVRAILSTGYMQADRTILELEDGMLGLVQKPYRLDQLADAVHRAMAPGRRAEQPRSA